MTGILLLINNTLVKWISKRQQIVEMSTYGSELVEGNQLTESILEYRYMLMMMGARLEKSTLLLGDNNSIVLNVKIVSSVLKKKHSVVSCHKIKETIVVGIVKFSHIFSEYNYADILTKKLRSNKFMDLVKPLLFCNTPTV